MTTRGETYTQILTELRKIKDEMISFRDSSSEQFIIDGINKSIKGISQAMELILLENGVDGCGTHPIYGAPFDILRNG